MKTQRLASEIRYDTIDKKYKKSVMYEFDFQTDILLIEKHDDGTSDHVLLQYELDDGDRAYFSEEYLPVGMRKDGVKKPDITAMVENPVKTKMQWFVYDIKATVMDSKVAMKLCSQWHQGIEHIAQEYLNTKSGYDIAESVGVVTRYWSEEKLQKEIYKYQEKMNPSNSLLTARKGLAKVNEYRARIKAAKCIIDRVYDDYDELTGKQNTYEIHYVILDKAAPSLFKAKMQIRLQESVY